MSDNSDHGYRLSIDQAELGLILYLLRNGDFERRPVFDALCVLNHRVGLRVADLGFLRLEFRRDTAGPRFALRCSIAATIRWPCAGAMPASPWCQRGSRWSCQYWRNSSSLVALLMALITHSDSVLDKCHQQRLSGRSAPSSIPVAITPPPVQILPFAACS